MLSFKVPLGDRGPWLTFLLLLQGLSTGHGAYSRGLGVLITVNFLSSTEPRLRTVAKRVEVGAVRIFTEHLLYARPSCKGFTYIIPFHSQQPCTTTILRGEVTCPVAHILKAGD